MREDPGDSPEAPAAAESSGERRERSQADRQVMAPSVGRAGSLAARPTDVAGRLRVRDRAAAVAAVADRLIRVGGREAARRQDGADVVVEALVPGPRYDDFVSGLQMLGAWDADPRPVTPDAPYASLLIRVVE